MNALFPQIKPISSPNHSQLTLASPSTNSFLVKSRARAANAGILRASGSEEV